MDFVFNLQRSTTIFQTEETRNKRPMVRYRYVKVLLFLEPLQPVTNPVAHVVLERTFSKTGHGMLEMLRRRPVEVVSTGRTEIPSRTW